MTSTKRQRRRGPACLATAAATVLCSAAASGQEGSTIEEVVVTATKRDASIQDLAISVQALTENVMAEQGITDITVVAASVPGLSLADGGPGYRTLYVRGVSSEYGSAGTTGVYIDDAFVQPGGIVQTIVEPLYFDIDRIEVLRGPQGTLFGGSSMGGTIRFITRQPDLGKFSASAGAETSYTEDGGFNYEVDGLLNLPIANERAGLRIVGAYRDKDGYVDKLIGDFSDPERQGTGPVTTIEDVNEEQYSTARLQLAVKATERFEIRPSVLYQKTESTSFGAFDRPTDEYDQRRGIAVEEPVEDELTLTNLTLSYGWDYVRLLSSTSYSERDASFKEDASDAVEATVLPDFYGLPRGLFFPTTYDGSRLEKSLQEELRLSSTGDSGLQWVAGVYYEDYEQENGFQWFIPGFSDVAFPVPNDLFFQSDSALDRTHKAAFAEINWPLTERLTTTLGLRWYEFEVRTQSFNRDGDLNGGPLPDGPELSSNEDGVTPRVSIAYDLGEQLMYVTASQGFRTGAPNSPVPGLSSGSTCVDEFRAAGIEVSDEGDVAPFVSDDLWNYEIGIKTSWAENRFVVNAAAYRMDWNDLQSLFIAPCGFGAIVNFGEARLEGVELDYKLSLTPAFELSGGINYNDARISEDAPELGVSEGVVLPNAPEWVGSLNARYGFSMLDGNAYALATVRYVGESFRSFDHSDPRAFQDSYTLVGARIGLERESWSFSLFADNVGDEDPGTFHFLSAFFGAPSHVRMFPLRGRTIGVNLRKDF